ncbi:eCIS core domain-containing protein [Flavitalea flava]
MHDQTTITPPAKTSPGTTPEGKSACETTDRQDVYENLLQRLPIQRKLTVGAVDDPLEKEADDMAGRILRTPETSFIQRKCSHCEEEDLQARRKPMGMDLKPFIQGKAFIQAKGNEPTSSHEPISGPGGAFTTSAAVSEGIQSTRGGGSPIPETTRSFMESRFGTDFSGVHIHQDEKAGQLSREINARAFTIGNDIYFNTGMYSPESTAGKHLLAHELTHVLQQGGGGVEGVQPKLIQRDEAVTDYHKGGFTLNPIETKAHKDDSGVNVSGENYWYLKLNSTYQFETITLTQVPKSMNPDAWSAILSRGWENRPPTLATAANPATVQKTALVPIRLGVVSINPGTAYRAYCVFDYGFDASTKKPTFKVSILRFVEDPGKITDVDKSPRVIGKKVAEETMSALEKADHNGFPGNDLMGYFKKHPDVKETLAGYLEFSYRQYKQKTAAGDLNETQIIRINETNGTVVTPLLMALTFRASREAGLYYVSLHYSTESNSTPAPDFNTKDSADFGIEDDLAKHPNEGTRLGVINGLDKVTDEDEKRIVKNLAVSYYTNESTKNGVTTRTFRDTEIDQIVPITLNTADPAKTEFNYYTFIIHKPDAQGLINMDVRKIGKKGDAVVGDPDKGLVGRIPGFAEAAFDADGKETTAKLIKWLQARYKGIKEADIKAATVKEISDKMNALIDTGSGAGNWFSSNYGITILDTAGAKARLKTTHKLTDSQLAGVKDFTTAELKMVELALEKMSLPMLKDLKQVFMARQVQSQIPAFVDASGLTQPGGYIFTKSTRVITSSNGSTVTVFDSAFGNKDRFYGGALGVNPSDSSVFSHELGHVIGNTIIGGKHGNPTIQDQFNKFYKDQGLTPITSYARDTSAPGVHSPESEFFPESVLLFNLDPEFLLNNQPQTYLWFLFLQQTGTAPSLDKIKSLIAVWSALKTAQGESSVSSATLVYFLWNAYETRAGKDPDPDNTATLILIIATFPKEKNRQLRTDETDGLVKKWLAFVKKQKKQPAADDLKTFF